MLNAEKHSITHKVPFFPYVWSKLKEKNLKKEVQKKGLEIVKNEKGKQKSCEERLEEECPVGTQSRPKAQGKGVREGRRGNIQNRTDRAEGGRAQTNKWKTVLSERQKEEGRTKGSKSHPVLHVGS